VLVDSWVPLAQAQGGALIVAAPAVDGWSAMRRAPGPLSNVLPRWTPTGWAVVR